MNIHYKSITHERTEDAPFVGALVCASSCHIKCKGCFNKDLKKEHDLVASAEDIINEVKQNPFNQGIILAGLEWSDTPQEMIELCRVASANDLEIIIYTGHTINDFRTIIGRSCCDEIGFAKLPENMITGNSSEMDAMIGCAILDDAIPNDYYIKAGKYDRDRVVDGREHFGVALASDNQNIYKFEKAVD